MKILGILIAALFAGTTAMAQNLAADRNEFPVAQGGVQHLFIDAGAELAGKSYAVVGSLTGTSPGTQVGTLVVPINLDAWTMATLVSANTPMFAGFRGQLNGAGSARASFVIPAGLPMSAIGLTVHHAALAYDGGGILGASNAVPLQLVSNTFDAAAFFKQSVVVDGLVNYGTPTSMAIGGPKFESDALGRTVKEATGINIGSMSLPSEEYMSYAKARLLDGRFSGAMLIQTAADIDEALAKQKYGVVFYTQAHFPLLGDLKNVQKWHAGGLRVFMIAYSAAKNTGPLEQLGGGAAETTGLTQLGRSVVDELIRLGMVIDLAHCNERTMLETAAVAMQKKVPVIANHTCARALANYGRNITDKAIRAIADTGGVVGVMAYAPYLRRPGLGNIEDYVNHLDHVVKVAGIDHVGVASDGYLDGTMANGHHPDGFIDSATRWKNVARRLAGRGYSENDLKKICGLNFLRVYRKVLK